MSAICGIYHKNRTVRDTEAVSLTASYGKYRFDQIGSYLKGAIFLSCHLKYLAPESLHETLPYEDTEASLIITADAIIDNREELFNLLSIPEGKQDMPDSLLILEAYKKWGINCPEKLVGDFAFAIWDRERNELFCTRDHTGRKTFYYHFSPDVFAFSTLMEPLLHVDTITKRLNETYIADFLAITGVLHELGSELTIYKDISSLSPAHSMLINRNGLKKWRYWEIKKSREIKFDTDAEYEAAFREVYSEAVRCRLRCFQKVGIMLSGGLDSGSVACLAASELKKRGETLYSFTQVPMDGYKDCLPEILLADEREYVEEICAFAGNIQPHYINSEGKNPLTEINTRIEYCEQPYKPFENTYWIDEIFKTAYGMDVGVMLGGQSGNATVSWGSFGSYAAYLLKTGRFALLLKESKAYAHQKKRDPHKVVLRTLWSLLPYKIREIEYLRRNGKDYFQIYSPVNPQFFQAMGGERRLRKFNCDPLFLNHGDSYETRKKMLSEATFSHLGGIEEKLSLAYSVEKRDPTRDKRVIEFCINLPENQWVRDGEERRFIRHAMKGYMPDKVRLNTTVRGRQAADWIQRIVPAWTDIYREMETIGENELERKYLDIPKIKRVLAKNKELSTDDYNGEGGVRLLIRALIFTRFLRNLDL